ncbi:hypothetical protein GLIP_0942 [Aliiglaciecola lipolytica E3]|uniref:Uncharacterized protein n=1 Tax=Aliiglaciecola lipolytica E3 TaxID=1127673 RepID=K6YQH8_9ALTE|nr:hypothetical protein GLIP_0942 [Aliiglaciecola lipolytica E3]
MCPTIGCGYLLIGVVRRVSGINNSFFIPDKLNKGIQASYAMDFRKLLVAVNSNY